MVTTESGSPYLIDFATMTWLRRRGPNAAEFRTTGGEFLMIEFVAVAEPMRLICPGLLEGTVRVLTTSPVTSLAWS